jgi:predicted nucleic acid binding AN1-type Zn finger protein
MGRCDFCGKATMLPGRCRYCSGDFCDACRLPEAHRCPNLKHHTRKGKDAYRKRMASVVKHYQLVEDRGFTTFEKRHPDKYGDSAIRTTPSFLRANAFFFAIIAIIAIGAYLLLADEAPLVPFGCDDGTRAGACSDERPYACLRGTLIEEPLRCGCPEGLRFYENACIDIVECSDGTLSPECSETQPKRCVNGTLIDDPNTCGCPADHRMVNERCMPILRCADGTEYGACAPQRPIRCVAGQLVEFASYCGCPDSDVPDGNRCVSKYLTGGKDEQFSYTLRGRSGTIDLTVYEGLRDYLAAIPRSYYCTPRCPTAQELELRIIDEPEQDRILRSLVEAIEAETDTINDRARIAISLVQTIPYDYEGYESDSLNSRYPYEVLYDGRGVCGEKSKLLAYLLRELGFGVALFDYDEENHQSVGIRCPSEYTYAGTDYCFIESTSPTIITHSTGTYVGAGTLGPPSEVIPIADGMSLSDVREEYEDANQLAYLDGRAEERNNVLSRSNYRKWLDLVDKYGITVSE